MINQSALQCTLQSHYKTFVRLAKVLLSSLVLSVIMVSNASAHLMVAQRGTLNFKGNGVFMVLSLPVSAFDNIDDDGDGKMSTKEFTKHKSELVVSVKNKVKLLDIEGSRPLQGLLLTPVTSHLDPKAPTEQLVIMGRFVLADNVSGKGSFDTNDLKFHVDLFGKNLKEKSFTISATRKLDSDLKAQKYKIVLTPEKLEEKLFTNIPQITKSD